MPYQPPGVSYTPIPDFVPPAFSPAPSSDDFLKSTMAAIQPGLSAMQAQYSQLGNVNQQLFDLANQQQRQRQAQFYYVTPPWGARQRPMISPPSTPAISAPVAPMTAITSAPKRSSAQIAEALQVAAKKFSGRMPSSDELTAMMKDAGLVQDDRGRWVVPAD